MDVEHLVQLPSPEVSASPHWPSDGQDPIPAVPYERPVSPSPHFFPRLCEYTTPSSGPGICRLPDKLLGHISFLACLDDVFRLSLTCSRMYKVFSEEYWRYRAELSSIALLDAPNAKVQLFGPIKGCCYHCSSPLLYNWDEMFAFRLKNWLGRANNIFPDAITHATMGVYFCGTCINHDSYYHPVHEFQIYQLDLSAGSFPGVRTMDTPRGRFYPFRATLARLSELHHPVMIPGPLGDQYEHLRSTFWQGIHCLVHLDQTQFNQLPLPTTAAPHQLLSDGRHDAQMRMPRMSLDSAIDQSTAQISQRHVFQPAAANIPIGSSDGHGTEVRATDADFAAVRLAEALHADNQALQYPPPTPAASGSKSISRATDSRSPHSTLTRDTSQSSVSRDPTPGGSRTISRQPPTLADPAEEFEDEMDEEQSVKGERKQELARVRKAQDKIMQDVKTEQLIHALRDYGYVGTPGFEADADVRRWIMGDWKGMYERGIRDLDDVVKTLLYRWTKSYGAAQRPGTSSGSPVHGQPRSDGHQALQAHAHPRTEGDPPHPQPLQGRDTKDTQTVPSGPDPTADFFQHGTGHMSLFEKPSGTGTEQVQGLAPFTGDQQQLLPAPSDGPTKLSGVPPESVGRQQGAEACHSTEPGPAAYEVCPRDEPSPVASSSRLAAPSPLPAEHAEDADEDGVVEEGDADADAEQGQQAESSGKRRPTGVLRPARSNKGRMSEPTRRSSRVRGADDK